MFKTDSALCDCRTRGANHGPASAPRGLIKWGDPAAPAPQSMPSDLEFTGERFVPGVAGEIAYEHWHRYAFARALVAGRRVPRRRLRRRLRQRAAGRAAATACGIDIDARRHRPRARAMRALANLRFEQGSAARCRFRTRVDVVVSFETIEHLPRADQPRMVAEIARVLAPGGRPRPVRAQSGRVFARARLPQSVPSARADRAELDALLAQHFAAQPLVPAAALFLGSAVWREAAGDAFEAVDRASLGRGPRRPAAAMYFVVVAARADGGDPTRPPRRSRSSPIRGAGARPRRRHAADVLRLDALLRSATPRSTGRRRTCGTWKASWPSARVSSSSAMPSSARSTAHRPVRAPGAEHFARLAARSTCGALRASLDESQASLREAQAALAAQERIIAYRQSAALVAHAAVAALARWWQRVRAHERLAKRHRHRRAGVQRAGRRSRTCVASVLAHLRPDVTSGADRRRVARPAHCRLFRRARSGARMPQVRAAAQRAQPGLHGHGQPRHAAVARGCRAAQLRHDRHGGWLDALMHCAATDARIGTITPFSNNAEICSFPRFCEEQSVADAARPGAAARRARASGGADVSRPADRRRLLPVSPARAARRDRRVRPRFGRGLRRGKRPLPARGARRLAQRARRQRVRRAHRRPLVRRAEGRTGRPQHGAAARRGIRTISTSCATTSPPIRCGRCATRRAPQAGSADATRRGRPARASTITAAAPKRTCAR